MHLGSADCPSTVGTVAALPISIPFSRLSNPLLKLISQCLHFPHRRASTGNVNSLACLPPLCAKSTRKKTPVIMCSSHAASGDGRCVFGRRPGEIPPPVGLSLPSPHPGPEENNPRSLLSYVSCIAHSSFLLSTALLPNSQLQLHSLVP